MNKKKLKNKIKPRKHQKKDKEDKRMKPLVRHYVDLNYDACLEGSAATLTYHNLVLDYIEEEIHEGSRGPLPVSHSKASLKVPDKFGETTLFFKESGSPFYKYDFTLWTDFSTFQTSEAGKQLLEKRALPYNNKNVKPTDRKQKLKKGELINYIFPHISSSFDVDLLRALKFDLWEDPIETKEEYVSALIKKLYENDFIPKHTSVMPAISNRFQTPYKISLHGSYSYDAFERIIQKRNSKK